jgi:anti-sigma regulatory factor (Ser/Thr protein kinase)
VSRNGISITHPTRPVSFIRSTRVPAAPDAALRARDWIFAQLREAGWGPDALRDVALAVDEAVQNAVEHGSEPDADIRLEICVDDDEAVVRVRDRGRPGVPVPTGEPEAPDPRSIRGRGRLIMANLAAVDWRPADGGGTEVRLRFCCDGLAEDAAAA